MEAQSMAVTTAAGRGWWGWVWLQAENPQGRSPRSAPHLQLAWVTGVPQGPGARGSLGLSLGTTGHGEHLGGGLEGGSEVVGGVALKAITTPVPSSTLFPGCHEGSSFAHRVLLPRGPASLQAPNNAANPPQTETYEAVNPDAPFLFLSCLSQAVCHSHDKQTNSF